MASTQRATAEELFGRLSTAQRRTLLNLLVLLADQDTTAARVGSA
jgi:hypothetical protein